ncbi:hypothetical protein [Wenzhouxiangella sp. EGI_FJ10305]|uniref:hypothetical protein n=1 Tax=Wenzhouxiangella sp. EGI_FJ10305 TaxID=3243768 RepID=UPI0035D864A1
MQKATFLCILIATSLASFDSSACDRDTGERKQHAFMYWQGDLAHAWTASPGAVERISLPTGFELGVELDSPSRQQYIELSERIEHVPEMVEIRLLDLSNDEPKQLSRTYGASNSVQGFGIRGGANKVDELGEPGIRLTLIRPVCLESIPASEPQ